MLSKFLIKNRRILCYSLFTDRIYLFKVNNKHTKTMWNMFKVINKDIRRTLSFGIVFFFSSFIIFNVYTSLVTFRCIWHLCFIPYTRNPISGSGWYMMTLIRRTHGLTAPWSNILIGSIKNQIPETGNM